MNAYVDEVSTPFGEVVFAVNERGEVLGLTFRDGSRRKSLKNDLRRRGFVSSEDGGATVRAGDQVSEYFAGERRTFDLPLAAPETGFERAIRDELMKIPFGETRSYGQIARNCGRLGEAIEVGRACAANPLLLIVPCHRVVGADGSLRGYAGGLRMKERLLDFEGALPQKTLGLSV